MSNSTVFILSLLFIFSCSQDPVLEGFDSQRWQADAEGCDGKRLAQVDEIDNRKAELVGLGQKELIEVFGKPDRHELYSRNKKAFIYFLGGGPGCSEPAGIIAPDSLAVTTDSLTMPQKKLVIRFNGIGRVKEIIVYKN